MFHLNRWDYHYTSYSDYYQGNFYKYNFRKKNLVLPPYINGAISTAINYLLHLLNMYVYVVDYTPVVMRSNTLRYTL